MSEVQNKSEEEKRQDESMALLLAFKNVFAGEEGELVLAHIEKIAHITSSTIQADDRFDLSHWREGRRSLALDIKQMLAMDIGKYKRLHEKNSVAVEKEKDSWFF